MIVRGYLTGSAWRDYQAGKTLSGISIEPGMKKNQKFPEPLLTPSTKAEQGQHDQPISREEIITKGIVSEDLWIQIETTAQSLFARGTEIAAKRGLILVDTKYEFGLYNNTLYLADEVHTQDSSRYWHADTYEELFAQDKEQRKLDKEYFRKWLMDRGYMGDGTPPVITEEVCMGISDRYKEAYRIITGMEFHPSEQTHQEELENIAKALKNI